MKSIAFVFSFAVVLQATACAPIVIKYTPLPCPVGGIEDMGARGAPGSPHSIAIRQMPPKYNPKNRVEVRAQFAVDTTGHVVHDSVALCGDVPPRIAAGIVKSVESVEFSPMKQDGRRIGWVGRMYYFFGLKPGERAGSGYE